MSELGPHARQFVDALREADEPTTQDRERVRGAVLAEIALASGAATAATAAVAATAEAATAGAASATVAAAKSAGAGAFFAAQWKVGALVAALGVAGTGTWFATQSESTNASPAPDADPPSAQTPNLETAPAKPTDRGTDAEDDTVDAESLEVVDPSPVHQSAAPRTAPAKRGLALDQEMRLLGEAQQAMKQGDTTRALGLLERHAAEHPSGVLSAERAGTRAIALCEAGKLDQGRAAARSFLAAEPKSPLAARVRAACLRPKAK